MIMWFILVVLVAVLVIVAFTYHKIQTCGCKKNENYHDTVYKYINDYNSVYGTPRPSFYDMCPEYNQWVHDANRAGKKIVDACNNEYPGDERCPRYLPWTPAPCSSLFTRWDIPE